jgi:hypothetical protein
MFMAEAATWPSLAPPPPSNLAASVGGILARLNSVISEEIVALNQHQVGELHAFTAKKNQLLFELTKALKSSSTEELQRIYAPQLQELRWRLDANKKLLAAHLEAAKEVSQTIIEAIRQADSDGTYVQSRRTSKSSQ